MGKDMNKKDIIALIISLSYSIFSLVVLVNEGLPEFVILIIPLILYWEYRHLKGDISFLKSK